MTSSIWGCFRTRNTKKLLHRFKAKRQDENETELCQQEEPIKAWEPEGPFPFLRLPRELRNEVYRYALSRPDHDEIWIRFSPQKKKWYDATSLCRTCPMHRSGKWITPTKMSVSLLLACRMVHDEALEILYANNNIWIDASPFKTLELLSRLPYFALNRIHHLKLWLDTYLNCGDGTGAIDRLSESELALARDRVQNELLAPWLALSAFIRDNMLNLRTLSIHIGSWRSESMDHLELVSPEWRKFYQFGWVEQVREMPQTRALLIEARCVNCEGLRETELDSFNDLRRDLWRGSRFKEVSVQWDSYFFACGGLDPGQFPKSSLRIALERQPDGDHDYSENEPILPPLPPFEQKYTKDDQWTYPWGCMMGDWPPRTPDHCR